ncbi:hypothetical protein MA16_Dca027240 [Dendrobium catenatum]|uniref:Uncharacterized protein n=1 Tax=Dendrobium catenatum TaxID=906689 RepID=A0A2I0VTQ4_9ASPA|nr:hypothetical protein MA16_Dca027240 [Dendrobium catenatum]
MAEGSSNFSVCVDNETYEDCTLLRVEGENVHGILLQIVQALNVFHVTGHHGHKLRDPSFMRYMQRSLDGTSKTDLNAGRR